jgi:hypothetical protein
MLVWTYAKIRKPENEGMWLPESYSEFVIKLNGQIIGTVKNKYRPKNAGGTAWEARATYAEFGGYLSMYSKDRKRVMAMFRDTVIAQPHRFGVAHLFQAMAA